MGPRVAAVRQNLTLIVDHAHPVPGLAYNRSSAWGSAKNQLQYTWRSALGTDPAGNLVYVAGNQLNLADLARALTDAGAVRGMELDIHPNMVTFTSYRPTPGTGLAGSGLAGTKLLPAMSSSTRRYLSPDQRDFLAVTLHPTPAGPTAPAAPPAAAPGPPRSPTAAPT